MTLTENEQLVVDFLKMVEERKSAEELDRFYHPEVQQIEYPNSIVKNTVIRSLEDLKAGSERGKSILTKEEYEIIQLHSSGNVVILEAIWTGTLAVAIGNLPVGGKITAHFAQFFEFRDGRILKQRNYDCFDPFT